MEAPDPQTGIQELEKGKEDSDEEDKQENQ